MASARNPRITGVTILVRISFCGSKLCLLHCTPRKIKADRNGSATSTNGVPEFVLDIISAPGAHELQSEEYKWTHCRPLMGSVAGQALSAIDSRGDAPVTQMGVQIKSEEHKAHGYHPANRRIEDIAQSMAEKKGSSGDGKLGGVGL